MGASEETLDLGFAHPRFGGKKMEHFRLPQMSLLKHAYILGTTGSGKTFLIYSMVCSLIRQHQGFCVLDIHGDLTQMVLSYLSSKAQTGSELNNIRERLVVIEPFDSRWAPAINPLGTHSSQQAYLQTADMFEIMRNLWADINWGPRMLEVLRNTLLTLSLSNLTLCDSIKLLTNSEFRSNLVRDLNDPVLKSYWQDRFGRLSDRMQQVYTEPVINKLSLLTDDFYLRHVLNQTSSKIDFRRLMDSGKWILINISKGIVGSNARITGSLLASKIRAAAMSRADLPENQRVPFYLFVDEFQNFLNYNFEEILSEARKFGLGLILAHQHLGQIDNSMRQAIFGNVGTLIFFRLGYVDVQSLAAHWESEAKLPLKNRLGHLGVGEILIRDSLSEIRFVKLHRLSLPRRNETILSQLLESNHSKYCTKKPEASTHASFHGSIDLRAKVRLITCAEQLVRSELRTNDRDKDLNNPQTKTAAPDSLKSLPEGQL